MKFLSKLVIIVCFYNCNNVDKSSRNESEILNESTSRDVIDSLFKFHFRILDSVAENTPIDTMYNCCYNSVNFMENKTGIDADVEGDYAGATGFKREDLRKWHDWYDSIKRYGK